MPVIWEDKHQQTLRKSAFHNTFVSPLQLMVYEVSWAHLQDSR